MDLLIGIFIGTIYGRNARRINDQTYHDLQRLWVAFRKTRIAFNLYMVADTLYERLAQFRNREVIYTHDFLCTCNRRKCLGYTSSISTYVRKLKAIN